MQHIAGRILPKIDFFLSFPNDNSSARNFQLYLSLFNWFCKNRLFLVKNQLRTDDFLFGYFFLSQNCLRLPNLKIAFLSAYCLLSAVKHDFDKLYKGIPCTTIYEDPSVLLSVFKRENTERNQKKICIWKLEF